MDRPFSFAKTPQVFFGLQSAKNISEKIALFGNRFILVTGANSFLQSTYGQKIVNSFNNKGLQYTSISVRNEPTTSFINEFCSKNKHNKYAVVVAIGGGSTIDAGKAISAMIYNEAPIDTYLEGHTNFTPHSGKKIPLIAVPTTAGTGSEATKNAVISEIGEHGFKRSLRHDNFVPEIAIIDPLLHVNCPPNITAASGLDAFTQLLEAYVSTQASILTDTLSFKGLELIANSLEKAFNNGNDSGARSEMALATYLSGIALANAGLGAVHGFASSVGGFFDIPHGVICGTLLGATNRKNIEILLEERRDILIFKKYTRIGKLFCPTFDKTDEYYLKAFADAVDALSERLNMPTLSNYGVISGDIERIVAKTSIKNNPVPLSQNDLAAILAKRI